MDKKSLISAVAETVGISKAQAKQVVNAALDNITSALADGDRVSLRGLGTLYVSETQARTLNIPGLEGREVPAGKRVRFKCSGILKSAVNA